MSYFRTLGIELDIFLNVLFGGSLGQTISLRAALAASRGSRPACAVCAALSALVQRNHCKLTLADEATSTGAALRSAVLLIALAVTTWNVPRIVLKLISLFS